MAKLIALLACCAGLVWADSAPAACRGDCDGDGAVTVDELVLAVNIALGGVPPTQCDAADADGDGAVSIGELIAAVNAALGGCAPARLVVLSREGGIASLDLEAPWRVRAAGDLGAVVASARCRAGRCLVVHPSPVDAISVVAVADVGVLDTIRLERGADPRDVAFVDGDTVVVSQHGRAELLELDIASGAMRAIDLRPLADADGLPETLRLASCGRRVFAQLRREEHDTQLPSPLGAALAVLDFDRPEGDRVVDVDPLAAGVQGVALAARPNFDMPVDCAAGVLYVAEPAPLMQGGGAFEQVDLVSLTAAEYAIDPGAEIGGFEVVEPDLYWLITHTTTGPGPSSHLNLFAGEVSDTHNTFAIEHVNDLALDRDTDQLFYPDPCTTLPPNPTCTGGGVFVFHARTGAPASETGIDVGFAPIEVVISR